MLRELFFVIYLFYCVVFDESRLDGNVTAVMIGAKRWMWSAGSAIMRYMRTLRKWLATPLLIGNNTNFTYTDSSLSKSTSIAVKIVWVRISLTKLAIEPPPWEPLRCIKSEWWRRRCWKIKLLRITLWPQPKGQNYVRPPRPCLFLANEVDNET